MALAFENPAPPGLVQSAHLERQALQGLVQAHLVGAELCERGLRSLQRLQQFLLAVLLVQQVRLDRSQLRGLRCPVNRGQSKLMR